VPHLGLTELLDLGLQLFLAQFVNTALITILVNNKLPSEASIGILQSIGILDVSNETSRACACTRILSRVYCNPSVFAVEHRARMNVFRVIGTP